MPFIAGISTVVAQATPWLFEVFVLLASRDRLEFAANDFDDLHRLPVGLNGQTTARIALVSRRHLVKSSRFAADLSADDVPGAVAVFQGKARRHVVFDPATAFGSRAIGG